MTGLVVGTRVGGLVNGDAEGAVDRTLDALGTKEGFGEALFVGDDEVFTSALLHAVSLSPKKYELGQSLSYASLPSNTSCVNATLSNKRMKLPGSKPQHDSDSRDDCTSNTYSLLIGKHSVIFCRSCCSVRRVNAFLSAPLFIDIFGLELVSDKLPKEQG